MVIDLKPPHRLDVQHESKLAAPLPTSPSPQYRHWPFVLAHSRGGHSAAHRPRRSPCPTQHRDATGMAKRLRDDDQTQVKRRPIVAPCRRSAVGKHSEPLDHTAGRHGGPPGQAARLRGARRCLRFAAVLAQDCDRACSPHTSQPPLMPLHLQNYQCSANWDPHMPAAKYHTLLPPAYPELPYEPAHPCQAADSVAGSPEQHPQQQQHPQHHPQQQHTQQQRIQQQQHLQQHHQQQVEHTSPHHSPHHTATHQAAASHAAAAAAEMGCEASIDWGSSEQVAALLRMLHMERLRRQGLELPLEYQQFNRQQQ